MTRDDQPPDPMAPLLDAWQAANERGDHSEAEAIGLQLLALASEHVPAEPDARSRLAAEAIRLEDAADWARAEVAWREVVQLSSDRPEEGMALWKAHHDLAALYALTGRRDQALAEERKALAAARRADSDALLCMALRAVGDRSNDASEQRQCAEEMLRALPDDRMSGQLRADALVLRACTAIRAGDTESAATDLGAAWRLLESWVPRRMSAGAQGSIARWHEARARLLARRGDAAGAAQAQSEAVSCWRNVAAAPQVEGPHARNALAGALRCHSTALRAAGDAAAAAQAEAESLAIRAAIGLPPLPD